MSASRRPAALPALLPLLLPLLLLSGGRTCQASPIQGVGDSPAIDPVPTPTEQSVIDVQEQIYIITGVFITFIIFLLAVSLGTAYVVIGMRQTMKALESAGAGLARRPTKASQKPPAAKRPAPAPVQQPLQRDNRAFAPDDDDDDDDNYRRGDDVQSRGYDQYPDYPRSEPPRAGRQLSSPGPHVSEPQPYDRFHQPLPDAHMPSDRARRDSHSRYGAGNLARLSKGPAPQPAPYDGRYPDERERRARSPGRGQW